MVYYCGIDIAKREHEVCVIGSEGRPVFQQRFKNGRQEAGRMVQQLLAKLKVTPADVAVVMEATGHYWLNLYSFLREQGFTVKVLNPIQSDAARNLYIRKTKTDAKDAFILADLLRMDRVNGSREPTDALLRLQTLERFRYELVAQIGSLKQRVIGVLDRIFPEYERLFSDVFIRSSRELLRSFPTPEELAAADLSEVARLLDTCSRGRLGLQKAEEAQNLARNTFGVTMGLDSFALELKLLLAQVQFMEQQVETVEEAIEDALSEILGAPQEHYRHPMETVPGVGPVVLATLLGEIADIRAFPSSKQLIAYSGIDASVSESGEFEGTRMHISKRGSPYLRRALWHCALGARLSDPRMSAYYQAKIQAGKHPKVAHVALMRKMAVVLYHVWKSGQPYNPEYAWTPT